MTIGEKIKTRRLELGLSLRELSDRMGYANHSTIARIESGKVDLPQSKIVKFAEVLNVSVAELMDWNEQEKKPVEIDELSDNMKKLIDFVKSVPEDKSELVLRVLRSIVEDD